MHFRVSRFPAGCCFPMYPPKYPFVTVCVRCVALVALFTLPSLIHRFLVQHCSCVCSTMGIRSLGLTSLLLPAKATKIPGMHPLGHSSFRNSSACPRELRTPLIRNLNCFAIPLQTNSGFVIHSGDMLFVHGAPCLHSFLFFREARVFGTKRFSTFVFGFMTRRCI